MLKKSSNLFQQSNDYIFPDRLANLQKLSHTAQINEINMQRDIASAHNLSWFDRCIKLLAQFCLGLACALALCIALVVGVRICGYCVENKIKYNTIPPGILFDNGNKPKEVNSDLDLSYMTLHKHLKEANHCTTTIDIISEDNDNM